MAAAAIEVALDDLKWSDEKLPIVNASNEGRRWSCLVARSVRKEGRGASEKPREPLLGNASGTFSSQSKTSGGGTQTLAAAAVVDDSVNASAFSLEVFGFLQDSTWISFGGEDGRAFLRRRGLPVLLLQPSVVGGVRKVFTPWNKAAIFVSSFGRSLPLINRGVEQPWMRAK